MSKLTDFYAHKASILEKGEPTYPQWELLECDARGQESDILIDQRIFDL